MSTNIAIAVALAVLAALVSGLAGHLEATKTWHKLFFWGTGLLMIILIGIQTYRNEVAQQHLQSQLDKIQRNTEQPPKVEVNIPPAPKQRAQMTLLKVIGIVRDPDKSDPEWAVNFYCKNAGTVLAKKVICATYATRIPATPEHPPSNQTLRDYWNMFSKTLSTPAPLAGVDLAPGEDCWGTRSLNMGSVVDPDLNTGNKVIMVAAVILFSDEAGDHRKEVCLWAQRPFTPTNPIWQYCAIGHNSDVY